MKHRISRIAVAMTASVIAANTCAQSSQFNIRIEKKAGYDQMLAYNNGVIPQTVRVWLNSNTNTASGFPMPVERQVFPRSTVVLNEFRPANPKQAFYYHYQYSLTHGDPSAVHDQNAKYLPPFFWPDARLINQAEDRVNNSHNSSENHFALDIDLPMGTPVMAAREGVVVANVKHFPDTGRLDRTLNDQANYVMILHGDGSFASYIHLKQNSSALVAGQRIATGDLIGLSGNSGYSSGPHLHFDVQVNQRGKITSVPFRFWDPASGYYRPKTGTRVQAVKIIRGETGQHKPLKDCKKPGNLIDQDVLNCIRRNPQ